jgi:CxxC motif-containing protein (DUF1111 family)
MAKNLPRAGTGLLAAATGLLCLAFDAPPEAPAGGTLTVFDATAQAYALPAPGLDAAQLEFFANGRQEFHQHWVVLPAIGGKWGRGPTSNGEECTGCHAGNGRGRAPETADENLVSMVLRLSMPGVDTHGGPMPHPHYGDQLQEQGELGKVPAEGEASIGWIEHDEFLADGTRVQLRSPRIGFRRLAFGPPGDDVLVSPRIAPPVIGAGLLDAVPEATLLEIAAAQRARGYNGRPNYVWDEGRRSTVVGRFGWKASQPSLSQQTASAYLADMGVTTVLYPADNCPPVQAACRKRPGGTVPEQTYRPFDEILFYMRALGVPAQRQAQNADVVRGGRLFTQAQCAVCHMPELTTGNYPDFPRLAHQTFRPYTDLLLHDMGEGLADGRPDYLAGPRDWRTAPLWGLGLSATVNGNAGLLHDGRARDATEAILWHGGEAAAAREAFRNMPRSDRDAMLAFLASL